MGRLWKKRAAQAFCWILIAVGAGTLIVALASGGAFPVSQLLRGLGFGVIGVIMLVLCSRVKVTPDSGARMTFRESIDAIFNRPPKANNGASASQRTSQNKSPMPPPHKPYPSDPKKPYGSKENPVVVGMPEYSTTLIYDEKNRRWILTDGLGNGWIR